MTESIVRLEEVSKRYVDDDDAPAALDGISISVEPGEFLGIMGQSGSGKTTLLNLVGGLDRVYEGKIEVLGRELSKMGDTELSRLRNNSIGFVFQSYHLLTERTCAENVALPALFRREQVDDLEERIDDVLRQVGLLERKGDRPVSLSGGQKQRIAIARAMLMRPKLLLCDEPTGNLDGETGREIMGALEDLSKAEGMTVLLVTHEEHVAEKCGRIIRLRDGKVQEDSE